MTDMVAIIYDVVTRQPRRVLSPVKEKPAVRVGELVVLVPLAFYRSFQKWEDFCRAVPQISASLEIKDESGN